MRRILIICALAVVLAAPLAAQASGTGSGTLSVKNATGAVAVAARGVLLGHCDRCTVTITNPNPLDGSSRVVQPLSVLRTPLSDTKTAYQGNDLRFKLIGGPAVHGDGLARRCRHGCATRHEARPVLGRRVADGQSVARFNQPCRHRIAHLARADPADRTLKILRCRHALRSKHRFCAKRITPRLAVAGMQYIRNG